VLFEKVLAGQRLQLEDPAFEYRVMLQAKQTVAFPIE
jgi:hypothetical protein